MFMSLFVIYGMDTASTLAEETKDPRRAAPKAVLSSVGGAFIIGGIFLIAILMAIPNLQVRHRAWLGTGADHRVELLQAMGDHLSRGGVGGDSGVLPQHHDRDDSSVLRHGARQPPAGSAALSRVHPSLHTPIFSCIVVAILAAIPLFKYAGAGIVAIAATGMIYLAYFLGNLAVLRARLKGWPREKTPFSLGKWGIPVNILALLWGGAMLVNFAWPRADSNPTPNQTRRRAQHRHRRTEQGADPLHRARGHLDHRRPLLLHL